MKLVVIIEIIKQVVVMKKIIKPLWALVIILIIWNLLCYLNIWSEYVLPSPMKVWNSFIAMAKSGELYKNISISLLLPTPRVIFCSYGNGGWLKPGWAGSHCPW